MLASMVALNTMFLIFQ